MNCIKTVIKLFNYEFNILEYVSVSLLTKTIRNCFHSFNIRWKMTEISLSTKIAQTKTEININER